MCGKSLSGSSAGVELVLVLCLVCRRYSPANRSVGTGLKYGLVLGVATGMSMGYGTYAVMPLPYVLALSWFLATVVQSGVAGLLVGLIVTDEA